MKKILIVVDMQNDFIDGSLGTPEAEAIVDNVIAKINTYTKIPIKIIICKRRRVKTFPLCIASKAHTAGS